jgi:hypothetical protein
MSDPYTAAWEEAEASVSPEVLVYSTLEFQHTAFLDENEDPVAIRIVNDTTEDESFTIEAGATFNPGEEVVFQAVPFRSDAPEFDEGRMPECQITIDNAGRELIPRLEAAVQMRADLIVIFRQYRSDDRTEPCYGPVQFVMRKVKVSGAAVTGTAQLDDLSNSKFPRKVYDPNSFPGLIP